MTPESIAVGSAGALVAIWLGYPVCVWIAAGLRRMPHAAPTRHSEDEHRPSVSVILATREDAPAVRSRIADLLSSDYPFSRIEIVVGLDLGARCTPEQLADLDRSIRVVTADFPGGKACALNRAVAAATGEVLVFADTYQRFAPTALPVLVDALSDPEVGVVTGSLNRGRPESWHPVDWYWRLERWLRFQESEFHSSVGVTGAIYALRHGDWKPLPPNLILDDLFAPMRLVLSGYRVRFVPGAVAQDCRAVGTKDEFRRKVRTLTGNFQLCGWLPDTLLPSRNPIWLQFVCHKLLRLLTPYLVLALVISLFIIGEREVGLRGAIVLGTSGGILVLLLASPLNRSATLRALVQSCALMPAAALVAAWNAIGRNWNVWNHGPASTTTAPIARRS